METAFDPEYSFSCCPDGVYVPSAPSVSNGSQPQPDRNQTTTGSAWNGGGGVSPTTPCQCLRGNQTSSYNFTAVADIAPPLYLYIYVTIAHVIIFSAGVLGNLLVIFVVLRMRSMRTRMNFYLVSLSMADLMVLIVCQPVALLDLYAHERWLLGAVMCKMIAFLENTAVHCSALCLLAISVERFVAICLPLLATRRKHSSVPTIAITWIVSMLMCLPFVFISRRDLVDFADGSQNWQCRTRGQTRMSRAYFVVDFSLCMILPLLAITFFYSAIVYKLTPGYCCYRRCRGCGGGRGGGCIGGGGSGGGDGGASGRGGRSKPVATKLNTQGSTHHQTRSTSRRQVIRMMVVVVAVFYVCLLPLRCIAIYLVFGPPDHFVRLGFDGYQMLMHTARLLTFVNSASNPVIYGLMCTKFRNAFATVLPKRFLQREATSQSTKIQTHTVLVSKVSKGSRRKPVEENGIAEEQQQQQQQEEVAAAVRCTEV